jgi:hypothetical protein
MSHFFLTFEYSRPFRDSFDLSRVNLDFSTSYEPAQDFHGVLFELALLWFEEIGFFLHQIKEFMGDLGVEMSSFLVTSCCNPPVIHVITNVFWVLLEEGLEVLVHGLLEEGWRIGEPKVHNAWDVHSKLHFDCGLVLILFSYSDIVVPHAYVKLQEECLSM